MNHIGRILVPDILEPIMVFRIWRIGDLIPGVPTSLYSTGADFRWESVDPGPADCRPIRFTILGWSNSSSSEYITEDHMQGCSCGYHGYYSLDNLFSHLVTRKQAIMNNAIGAIEVWGHVVVHELGVRAQYARIKALRVPFGKKTVVEDKYGIKPISFNQLVNYEQELIRQGKVITDPSIFENKEDETGTALCS